MEEGHFRPRDSETPEPSHPKIDNFDSVHSPTHTQIMVAATRMGELEETGEFVLSRAFFIHAKLVSLSSCQLLSVVCLGV